MAINTSNYKRLAYEHRQALELIENSKYFKTINPITMLHAKYLNSINIGDIESASKIVDQMVEKIVNDK